MTSIRTKTPPNLKGEPFAEFRAEGFDAAIWNKGYRVLREEARQCPCRSKASGSPLPNCQNCRGFGWTFLNPIQTKGIVSNIGRKEKFVEWSEESVGTISLTLMVDDQSADYDRITFLDVTNKKSEILRVRESNGQQFVFLTYKPLDIIDVFLFEGSAVPLTRLSTAEYNRSLENDYILLLDFVEPTGFNNVVTVTYNHYPQYHVIDSPHSLRASTVLNDQGQIEKQDLPINVICRKTHVIFGVTDFDGTEISNSYLT